MDPFAYHFDLRAKPLEAGPGLDERIAYLERITADPLQTNPVTVIQLALGTLQLRDTDHLPLRAIRPDARPRPRDGDNPKSSGGVRSRDGDPGGTAPSLPHTNWLVAL